MSCLDAGPASSSCCRGGSRQWEGCSPALRSCSAWIARPQFQICGLWAKANAAAAGKEEQEAPYVRKVERVLLERCQSEESNGCDFLSGCFWAEAQPAVDAAKEVRQCPLSDMTVQESRPPSRLNTHGQLQRPRCCAEFECKKCQLHWDGA